MERTRQQNIKLHFEYNYICYTGCVKYAIFTSVTTVQIFRKRRRAFPMQKKKKKTPIKTCYSDYTDYSILHDSARMKTTLERQVLQMCEWGCSAWFPQYLMEQLLSRMKFMFSSLNQDDWSGWLSKQGEDEGGRGGDWRWDGVHMEEGYG